MFELSMIEYGLLMLVRCSVLSVLLIVFGYVLMFVGSVSWWFDVFLWMLMMLVVG